MPAGFTWGEYVDHLAETHGSLAAVALQIALSSAEAADVASIERGLRRLRTARGDGGTYGVRLLRRFGLPASVERRARWMGLYHSRFADLPISFCLDQLRLWDRPPVAESAARAYVVLGLAHCAVRAGDLPSAATHIDHAKQSARNDPIARCEALLVGAYVIANQGDAAGAKQLLDRATSLLGSEDTAEEAACFRARVNDQLAYLLLRRPDADLVAAKTLYEAISPSGPPFARCKRENGLAYVAWRAGQSEAAVVHARAAVTSAGDGGLVRQRAIALSLLARVATGAEANDAAERAHQLATAIEDEDLLSRLRTVALRGS